MTKLIIFILFSFGTISLTANSSYDFVQCISLRNESDFFVQVFENKTYMRRFNEIFSCDDLESYDVDTVFLACESTINTHFLNLKKNYTFAVMDKKNYRCKEI